jgi:hypothetical protein
VGYVNKKVEKVADFCQLTFLFCPAILGLLILKPTPAYLDVGRTVAVPQTTGPF